ncbi:hypothetical protein [Kamptonema formosum]|nr:hypothetical protein [Oscillatoria sp. PCC 10802]
MRLGCTNYPSGDKETGFLNKGFGRDAKVIAETRFLPLAPAPARE